MTADRLLQRIGSWISGPRTVEIETPCGDAVYLTRYFLLGSTYAPFAVMLHQFHQSDIDRHLHDHPWAFWTCILTTGYWEITPAGRKWYPPFSILFRPAAWRHRVEIIRSPTWTLVIRPNPRDRVWGFHTENGFIAYRDYDFSKGCE